MTKKRKLPFECIVCDEEPQEVKDKRNARRRTKIDNTQGFIGKINQARQVFEKLYKS